MPRPLLTKASPVRFGLAAGVDAASPELGHRIIISEPTNSTKVNTMDNLQQQAREQDKQVAQAAKDAAAAAALK